MIHNSARQRDFLELRCYLYRLRMTIAGDIVWLDIGFESTLQYAYLRAVIGSRGTANFASSSELAEYCILRSQVMTVQRVAIF